jgi:ferredoxin-NADP reductase
MSTRSSPRAASSPSTSTPSPSATSSRWRRPSATSSTTAWGAFSSGPRRHQVKRFAAIAGGTGITPIYQIIRAVLDKAEGGEDRTHVSLVYANQSTADILLREELDELAHKHADVFHVHYTVSSLVIAGASEPPAMGFSVPDR